MKSLILFCWIGLLGWCFGIPGKHIGPVKIITLCKLCESQYSLIGNPKHLKNEIKNLKEQLSILKRENEMFKQIQRK